jgi:hypothetical protein
MANAGSNPGTYARWMSKSVVLMTALTFSVLGDMQVSARLGDTVELCLKEPSTTGYRWDVTGSLPSGVEQRATSYRQGVLGYRGVRREMLFVLLQGQRRFGCEVCPPAPVGAGSSGSDTNCHDCDLSITVGRVGWIESVWRAGGRDRHLCGEPAQRRAPEREAQPEPPSLQINTC